MIVYVENRDPLIERMFANRFGATLTKDYTEAGLVVFSGGTDVDPHLYNEDNHYSDESDVIRDASCMVLFEYCVANTVPMVGICRGSQFLNVMNGGKLWQDVNGHACGNHCVYASSGEVFEVTSTHHQMMRPGPGAQLLAWASESTDRRGAREHEHYRQPDPEVVLYKDTSSLCFQPHPEYGGDDDTFYYFSQLMEELYEYPAID